MLPKGILGLNADYVNQYVMYMTSAALKSLDLSRHNVMESPAKWMAAANDTQACELLKVPTLRTEVNGGK